MFESFYLRIKKGALVYTLPLDSSERVSFSTAIAVIFRTTRCSNWNTRATMQILLKIVDVTKAIKYFSQINLFWLVR